VFDELWRLAILDDELAIVVDRALRAL
jgi:hypothetical protein